jgi:hypothetical protein
LMSCLICNAMHASIAHVSQYVNGTTNLTEMS